MGAGRYFFAYLLLILTFLSLTLMIVKSSDIVFIRQLYLAFFLLIMAGIALFTVASNINSGWLLFTLFYSVFLINTLYLHFEVYVGRSLLFVGLTIGVIGLFFSAAGVGSQRMRHHKRKIIVEDIVDEPVQVVKIKELKKQTSKSQKKTVKKVAKKKAAKKNVAKRKVAKRKVAKRKVVKKKATKKKVKKVAKRKPAKRKVVKKKATKKKVAERKIAERKIAKRRPAKKKSTKKKVTRGRAA